MQNINYTKSYIQHISQKIDSRLQDDESREIFMYRLQYLLDSDETNLYNLVDCVNKYEKQRMKRTGKYRHTLIDFLSDKAASDEEIILYGAGGGVQHILNQLNRAGLSAICICDSNPDKQGTIFYNLEVISPDKLVEKYNRSKIIISSTAFNDEIYDYLIFLGISDDRIITGTSVEREYFGPPFIHLSPDEIYVDVGCFNGDTIYGFNNASKGHYSKIIALEPDTTNLVEIEKKIIQYGLKGVELIPKGAWSSDTILKFHRIPDGGSRVFDNGSDSIQFTTIDSVVKNSSVSFIKMDIEGSELEALKGAADTIKRCRPKLAICVYHKPEDIIDLPLYIMELVPEYKLYLRHYSPEFVDTVLYAI